MFTSVAVFLTVLGFRILTEEECPSWLQQYNIANNSCSNRSELLSQAAIDLERNSHIVGATAIEDKLQEGVPETIANLHKADIKLWVCTGDKRETAIEIGYSSKVLTPNMKIMQIVSKSDADAIIATVAKEFLYLLNIGKLPQYSSQVTDTKTWFGRLLEAVSCIVANLAIIQNIIFVLYAVKYIGIE